jgi:dienelactone hydrolase
VKVGAILVAAGIALALPAAASADPTPLGLTCAPKAGVRFCPGNGSTQRVATFDKVPIDADVTLPASGDGPFPTIVMLHGWGGSKSSFESADGTDTGSNYHYNNIWFAQQGYAVLNYSARGFGNSCGMPPSRTPDCLQQAANGGDQSATGWIHLKDRRREAHDTQFLLGTLVDQGIADGSALAATGISYGGGESIELAYLNNRTQLPDGTFTAWTSPGKKIPLRLGAAWPRWPWSDLVSSLEPNGRFLDFDDSTNAKSRFPIGIPIQSYISGLLALGHTTGWVAPPGADPHADLDTWNARVVAGDPANDPVATQIADEIYGFHQGFGCSGCGTPAPLLIENGWTDDLFPPAEALRVYNSLRATDPGADVALQFADLGHARGSNKKAVDVYFNDQGNAFFGKHLRGGSGAPPRGSVTAFTQTCPADTAPAAGPFVASAWPLIHPGAVRFGAAAAQTVTSAGGNAATGQAIDPIAGGGDACTNVPDDHAQGTARIAGPRSPGYTMLGLPTVQATVKVSADYAQLDSRLWDVAPDGTRILVSRGAYRLELAQDGKRITFQLHGNGWRFAPGHVPQLELLGNDAPYLRPSNSQFTVTVSNVVVELPTVEAPGANSAIVNPSIGRRAPRLSIRAKPGRVRSGRRARVTFTVRSAGRRVRGARVKFAGRVRKTGRRGTVRFTVRMRKPGMRTATAAKRGYRSGRVRVRVV